MNVVLTLVRKDGSTVSFPLPSSVTTIGRRQECDLCIPLMVVSRKHCEINQDRGQVRLRDLGSRNGTLLNDNQVDEGVLDPGDKIGIGPLTFVVQIDGKPTELPKTDSVASSSSDNVVPTGQEPQTDHDETIAEMNNFDYSDSDDYSTMDLLEEFSE